jgi:hypothetical protein
MLLDRVHDRIRRYRRGPKSCALVNIITAGHFSGELLKSSSTSTIRGSAGGVCSYLRSDHVERQGAPRVAYSSPRRMTNSQAVLRPTYFEVIARHATARIIDFGSAFALTGPRQPQKPYCRLKYTDGCGPARARPGTALARISGTSH